MDKKRKVALVTGGSRGIGGATSRALANAGARVAINYLKGVEVATEVRDSLQGDDHLVIQADVSDPTAIRNAVEQVIEQCGRLDILINNAGAFEFDNVLTATYDEWQETWSTAIGINLLGTANASFCAVQHMAANGGGRIVNVGSRGAYRGDPEYLGYVAAKAGVKAMAQSLAIAVAGKNIFVGTVAPGFVDTDMAAPFLEGDLRVQVEQQSPMGRIAKPEEIATAIAFLAIDAPYAMSGCIVDVNGASWIRP